VIFLSAELNGGWKLHADGGSASVVIMYISSLLPVGRQYASPGAEPEH
jgi:hypothetical protein